MASRTRSSRPVAFATVVLVATALTASTGAATAPRFHVCLVTGASGPTGPLAGLAEEGLTAAEQHGAAGRVLRAGSPAAFAADLRVCATHGAALTIAAGFPTAGAIDTVASSLPEARFAAVDVDVGTLAHRPKNVRGLVFAGQQAGYLVGYAAGLWAKAQHADTIGSVGGLDIPPVERFIAGFQFGAARADPGLNTLNSYSDDFGNPAACRSRALEQIRQGSVVEFEVAGACGRGVLAAAHEHGVFAIGVGTGLVGLGPWVMTSALERIDVAVAAAIASAGAGTLGTGVDDVFGASRDGVGTDAWSARVPKSIRSAVSQQFALLKSGRVTGIPVTVR